MKNVCIVLKKGVNAKNGGESLVFDALERTGYFFDELRILSQSDENSVKNALSSLKKEADLLFLLCDKTALPVAKGYIGGAFDDSTQKNAFGNAAIYDDGKCALFLLSADGTETGVGFVENACVPFLERKATKKRLKTVVRAVGANEARVMQILSEIGRLSGGKIRTIHERIFDEDRLILCYDETESKAFIDDVVRFVLDGFGDTVYALEDESLEKTLVSLLKLRGKKISVAESFTGGGIAKRITSVSGASAVYFEGLNTYDERSKQKRLGVTDYALKTFGAVSDQTAYEMASGLLSGGDCDISIATTGLAGPKSDRSMLPVGLCYIAVGTKEKVYVYRYKFDGTREEVTEKAINYALFLAYKRLKDL